jgi:cytochrome c oxidase subunit 3
MDEPRTLLGPPEPVSAEAGLLGMRLFLVALGMLFAAAVVGFLVVRLRATGWPPTGTPGLPLTGLWIATAFLAALSFAFSRAERALAADRQAAFRRALAAALLLAVGFLIAQAVNWREMLAAGAVPKASMLAFGFFVLTALHALHVLGGLPPLVLTVLRARTGRYETGPRHGVHWVAMYWHFLGATWLALFAVLAL